MTFPTRWIAARIEDMRMQPKPVAPIPIWIGGSSDAALARAARHEGWHGSRITPEQAAPIAQRLRTVNPDPGFALSIRCRWDGRDQGELRARIAAYGAAGIQHLLIENEDREAADWMHRVEQIAACRA